MASSRTLTVPLPDHSISMIRQVKMRMVGVFNRFANLRNAFGNNGTELADPDSFLACQQHPVVRIPHSSMI